MSAAIRYFCIVGNPVSFEYLKELSGSIYGLSVAPIGPMFLHVPPWNAYAKFFGKEVNAKFVNIVCAMPGIPFGANMMPGSTYEPDTVFSSLYTIGVPNVAIVSGVNGHEEAASVLNLYDRILCPTQDIKMKLRDGGVDADLTPPDQILDRIADLIP